MIKRAKKVFLVICRDGGANIGIQDEKLFFSLNLVKKEQNNFGLMFLWVNTTDLL